MNDTDEPRPPPGLSHIAARYRDLLATLRAAAERAGRDPHGFRVVAVTKTWPVEVARAALDAGIGALGESRVQEAEPKVAALPDAEWHFVGRLQSNKARRAAGLFAMIHSVDSDRLLELLAAGAAIDAPRVLLQVNLGADAAAAGFTPDALRRAAPELLRRPGTRVSGLMTIARLGTGEDEARATFGALRHLRDELQERVGLPLPELSMGMSADAEAAVSEGATLVRVGTALFGPRVGRSA